LTKILHGKGEVVMMGNDT